MVNFINFYGYIRVSLYKVIGWRIKYVDICVYIYYFVNKDVLS